MSTSLSELPLNIASSQPTKKSNMFLLLFSLLALGLSIGALVISLGKKSCNRNETNPPEEYYKAARDDKAETGTFAGKKQ